MPDSEVTNTDLTLATPADVAAYLASLGTLSAQDREAEADVNVNKLSPRLVLSRDSELMAVKLGDQTMNSVRFLNILVVLPTGQRALFLPENHPAKDEFKAPLCSTGMVSPLELASGGRATWRINPHFPTPYLLRGEPTEAEPKGAIVQFQPDDLVEVECARCQWNRFGSEGAFNPARPDAKGKACKESRVWFFRPLKKVKSVVTITNEELGIFDFDPEYPEPLHLQLGLGSNKKVLEEMVLAAKARRLPFTSAVFKVGCRIERQGSIAYPVLTYEFAGVPLPPVKAQASEGDLAWAQDYVSRNPRLQPSETEVPF